MRVHGERERQRAGGGRGRRLDDTAIPEGVIPENLVPHGIAICYSSLKQRRLRAVVRPLAGGSELGGFPEPAGPCARQYDELNASGGHGDIVIGVPVFDVRPFIEDRDTGMPGANLLRVAGQPHAP